MITDSQKNLQGLAEEFTTENPILDNGQIGIETDTNKYKFGDGKTAWVALPYAIRCD
jgi:hypothetical protein